MIGCEMPLLHFNQIITKKQNMFYSEQLLTWNTYRWPLSLQYERVSHIRVTNALSKNSGLFSSVSVGTGNHTLSVSDFMQLVVGALVPLQLPEHEKTWFYI